MFNSRCLLVLGLSIVGMLGCQAQNTSDFQPPREEFVRDDGEPENMFMDLDTGKLYTPPSSMHGSRQALVVEWARETGVDVVCETIASVRGLVGFQMVAIPVDASLWSATGGDAIHERLSWAQPGTPVALSAKGELPATFIIKTREGGAGVLQIVRLIDDPPRGARIRYKLLVQRPSGRVPLETTLPVGEATMVASATASLPAATGTPDTPEGVLVAAEARLERVSGEYAEARSAFAEGSLSFSGLLEAAEAASEARLRVAEADLEQIRARGGNLNAAKKTLRDVRMQAVRGRADLLSQEVERCRALVNSGKITQDELDKLQGQLKTARALLEMMRE